jgi:hypothetical protein
LINLYNNLSPEWQEEFWHRYYMLACEIEAGASPNSEGRVAIVSR